MNSVRRRTEKKYQTPARAPRSKPLVRGAKEAAERE
jgi:hypothetical protein